MRFGLAARLLLAAVLPLAFAGAVAAAEPGPDASDKGAAGHDDTTAATATRLALPAEPGQWRTRSQPVYDARTQQLLRRTVTIFDTRPSLARDFVWIPDGGGDGAAERVTGTGRLVWRAAGKPAYDPAAFLAEYRGRMRDGRPDGQGSYRDRLGLAYEGAWAAGLPQGQGRLTLGTGAEYAGRFQAGAADGPGLFYDVDGEVFEGRFRTGWREGRGLTRLPGGGSYLSQWVSGEEVANSRKLRLAQLGPVRSPVDDVRLGITVERADDPTLLQYGSYQRESGLVIQPSSRRLMELWKGEGAIQLVGREEDRGVRGSYGVFAYAKDDLPPLTLVFEVQNRAAAAVRVRGAYLDVESSVTDLQPAIQLTVGSSGECSARARPDYSPRFELENFGWGAAERAKLRFGFANPQANLGPSGQTVTKDVGAVVALTKVDLEPELRAAGVKVDQLKRRAETGGIACRAKGNAAACLAEIAATGLFGTLSRQIALEERDIVLNATGSLDYGWKDVRGREADRTQPFTARLLLGRTPVEAECGEGAEKEAIAKRPLDFRLDQTGYRLPVAFERTIPAGRSARYTVSVQAAKSSAHRFKVVLQTADGRLISSRPIALTYFLPSRASDNMGQ